MTGEITSASEGIPAARKLPGQWGAFASFMKRPALPETLAPASNGLRATITMFGFDLVFMSAFIAVLIAISAAGFVLPNNLNASLEMNLQTVLLVVVAAPVLEEIVFRSWLSGKPGYFIAFLILCISGAVAAWQGAEHTGTEAEIGVGLSLLVGLVLSLAVMFALRKSPAMGWFTRGFPVLFWLSSLAFALVHLLNYTEGALVVLLLLVIPQFVLGSVAAYLRVNYGLVFAILIHALHNGFALSIAALGMAAGMEG